MGLHRHGAACGCRPGSLDCDDFDFCEHGTSSSRSGRHPRATRFRPGPGSRIDRDRVGGQYRCTRRRTGLGRCNLPKFAAPATPPRSESRLSRRGGSGAKGATRVFHGWEATERPSGWTGPRGAITSPPAVRDMVKVLLKHGANGWGSFAEGGLNVLSSE